MKLRKGELTVRQDSRSIIILKWRDRWNMTVFSKHDVELNPNSALVVIYAYPVNRIHECFHVLVSTNERQMFLTRVQLIIYFLPLFNNYDHHKYATK